MFSRYLHQLLASVSLVASAIIQSPTPGLIATRGSLCQHGASDRACWVGQNAVLADSDDFYPNTGSLVRYTLTVTNATCNLDGSGKKPCTLVNGQFPGPTIRAQWGDTLEIIIVNRLQNNGTSIHFHGVRQLHSPGSDGVNGITQCAIAPGDSATYSFRATQYGSSWYHSHTSVQYGDGVLGPIVFDGPSSANYDLDLGPYVINDYYGTTTIWQLAALSQADLQKIQAPPLPTSILINGTAKSPNGGGKYNVVTVQRNKRYRLRLINTSTSTYIRVSLDQHSMLVIAADFVPIQPFTVEWLLIGIGQRYDVVITTNKASETYWFRANFPYSCYNASPANGTAIWVYEGSNFSIPKSKANDPEPYSCVDESFIPLWPEEVPPSTFNDTLDVTITSAVVTPKGDSMVVWALTDPIWTNYSDPTIGYLMRGDTNYPALYNTINTQAQGKWNYWLILNNVMMPSIPHPIHLHGHNFYVIGSGVGQFNEHKVKLNWNTPVRRDTQSVPGNGWLAIAFKSNNPGTWLMHCHIATHIAEGLGMQYIEAPNHTNFPDRAMYDRTCANWAKYQAREVYVKDDSGL